MPGAAATVGSAHVCPMLNPGTPPPPHVGGPVSGPGVPTVLIGGSVAAVMGDMCVCMGPPDVIAQGEATVLIGGKAAATVGSMTAHGGLITSGVPTVLIGTGGSGATAVMAVNKIPFPKINFALKTMASISGRGSQLSEAAANQQALREAAEDTEGDPKIYGIRIVKQDTTVRESMYSNALTIKAHVMNIDDGQSITFKVTIPPKTEEEEEQVIELTGTVQDKEVSVDWQPEDNTTNTKES